ncbi:MAG: zinc ribbon domain-containing protein [Lachnospiraceae bacterium]|nr:zinc ribbon domain-containing protein [Lachnospiraceae bacterium]
MFCTQCGSNIPDGSKFCHVCGSEQIRPNAINRPVQQEQQVGTTQPYEGYNSQQIYGNQTQPVYDNQTQPVYNGMRPQVYEDNTQFVELKKPTDDDLNVKKQNTPKSGKKGLIIGISIFATLLVAVTIVLIVLNPFKKDEKAADKTTEIVADTTTDSTYEETSGKAYIINAVVNTSENDIITNMERISIYDERYYHFELQGLEYGEEVELIYKVEKASGSASTYAIPGTHKNGDQIVIKYFDEDDDYHTGLETINVKYKDTKEDIGSISVKIVYNVADTTENTTKSEEKKDNGGSFGVVNGILTVDSSLFGMSYDELNSYLNNSLPAKEYWEWSDVPLDYLNYVYSDGNNYVLYFENNILVGIRYGYEISENVIPSELLTDAINKFGDYDMYWYFEDTMQNTEYDWDYKIKSRTGEYAIFLNTYDDKYHLEQQYTSADYSGESIQTH